MPGEQPFWPVTATNCFCLPRRDEGKSPAEKLDVPNPAVIICNLTAISTCTLNCQRIRDCHFPWSSSVEDSLVLQVGKSIGFTWVVRKRVTKHGLMNSLRLVRCVYEASSPVYVQSTECILPRVFRWIACFAQRAHRLGVVGERMCHHWPLPWCRHRLSHWFGLTWVF